MEPALAPGDRVLLAPLGARSPPLERGALIVLDDPERAGRRLIKRVAGLPGDVVWTVPSGIVLGPAGEPDMDDRRPPEGVERTVVPADCFFVMSDRPDGARDSRRFGPIARSAIRGIAWFRYHPPGRRGPLAAAPPPTRGSPRP